MKILEFFKRHFVFFFLLVFIFSTSWSLFYYSGLNAGHDLNHEARIFEMAKGLSDGNFPVIWSENLAYGYGMPLFEFYAPLPYFVGAVFYLIGLNLGQSVKAIILIVNILTAVGAYSLAKILFKDKWLSILITSLIVLAPYRAVNLFVRSAISEAWAIAFLIYVLMGVVMIVKNIKFGYLVLPLSLACLILSHNLTALMAVPFIIMFTIFFILFNSKSKKTFLNSFIKLLIPTTLGLGLSAFYFLPALIEKDFTKINEFILSSYYDFRQHFLYIRQFFKPWGSWEYGGSGWGPDDEMSYFLGFAQLLVLSLSLTQSFWFVIKFKEVKNKRNLFFQICLLLLVILSLSLTLLKTQKIWEIFSFTAYFQFPWRFLSISLIFIGLLAGNLYFFLGKKTKKFFLFITLLLIFIINPRYFQSEKYLDNSIYYQDYVARIRSENSNNLYDYIPVDINFFTKQGFYLYKNPDFTLLNAPSTSVFNDESISQKSNLIINKSTKKMFTTSLLEDQLIVLNISYYPGWIVKTEKEKIEVFPNENGLIIFELPTGQNEITLELQDTPIRFFSKIVSLISLCVLIIFSIISFKKK